MLAVIAVLSIVGTASATTQRYWLGYVAGGGGEIGPRHTLAWNVGSASANDVCLGQLNASGAWTGSYECSGSAVSTSKEYCQCALYYPKVHNGRGSTQLLVADSVW